MALLAAAAFAGCQKEKDGQLPNQKPETTATLRAITLADDDYLVSSVAISWSGTDGDGFVKAYELSTDGQSWSRVTRTDSLIRFSFTTPSPTQVITLRVRAIDNQGGVDDTPAELLLPIKNQPPVAIFRASDVPYTDTVLFALTLPTRVTDPDGNETLDSVLIRCNGGSWVNLPKNTTVLTFIAENPDMAGAQPARIYRNGPNELLPVRLEGFVVEGRNTFEITATDIARSRSPIGQILNAGGQQVGFYVRRKTADLLVIDNNTSTSPSPEATYFPILAQVAPQYDYVDFNRAKGSNQPRFFNVSMPLVLRLYPRVFWYMDDSRGSTGNRSDTTSIILETAAPLLARYLEEGGKLLLTTRLPDFTSRLPPDARSFGLIPADSLYQGNGQVKIKSRAVFNPLISDLPTLVNLRVSSGGGTIDGADVFKPSPLATPIYQVDSAAVAGVTPYRTIAARRNGSNGRPNFYFFSVELNRLSDNPAMLQQLFYKVLIQDFQ